MFKKYQRKNKYKHFRSKSHIEFDKCKHPIISHKDIDINDADEAFFYTLSNIITNSIIIL